MDRIEYIKWLENVLYRLISCEHYFKLVSGRENQFWPIVQNSLGESVCIFWSHVFGNKKDDLHYSKFFNDDIERITGRNFSRINIEARMLTALKMNDTEYENFWKEVKSCRNQFIAHKEIGSNTVFYRIDLCRVQAEELRVIMAEFVQIALRQNLDGNWDIWNRYYQAAENSNSSIEAKCKREFKNGVLLLSDEIR
ncbi:MAG: hypothetical protein K8F52_16645 [Candidatus Scalindua rubra]|uniref:HEPN AbiU2-like domain-containing protein n=1 Tax=Candidatus Scalindua brodae TaxID=237368 RepID=A0A0B0EDW3_9BACT|nr:MAG: hypothetical protein SCABRO_03410 [Candidatus Scalindua brodae]MBZ0110279.1 hypothetical protein [Candidatus Scalindua rubra]TWU33043.1 hypothetical protein S225a_14920 [Candidatus Brocadiaceae bacterium S225]